MNILMCISSLSRTNGVAKFVFSYYKKILEQGYSVDFFLTNDIIDEEYKSIITNNNGKIFFAKSKSRIKRYAYLYKNITDVMKLKKYDIVHVNLVDDSALACIKASKASKVKKIIYHVHNPYRTTKLLFVKKILNILCIKYSTDLLACTFHAGKSMFGRKKFLVVNNALNLKSFEYDENYRNMVRKKLKIENKKVIGVSARIDSQKNPFFILKIFKNLHVKDNSFFLLWAGSGKYSKKVKKYIKRYKLENDVMLAGNCKDMPKLYSAFDYFLLPSKYEGLGIVFIEAQASGLKTYASTNVPRDVELTDLITFVSLTKSSKKWANIIMNDNEEPLNNRKKYYSILSNTKFNINNSYKDLINIYGENGI